MITKRSFLIQQSRVYSWLIITAIFILIFSVRHGSAAEILTVYAVNYPLKYFAERIGGDHVKVEFPAPADVDPAHWNPDLENISAYQKADLILINGAGYAKWVNKVSLPRSKMVNTSRQFKDQYITSKEVMTHSHGGEGKHAHESLAFTTWLDLELAARQAEAIAAAMGRKQPALQKTFQANHASLAKELKALDQKIQAIVSKNPSMPLIVSHPVYDYFARRYRLNIVSVHWEPDEAPGDEQWLELKKILKHHPAKWMIWEGDPLKATIEKLKGLQINSIVFNPCGNVPAEGDFLTVMRQNIENLKMAFDY
jgi:zinc transport system substrate-binding protein